MSNISRTPSIPSNYHSTKMLKTTIGINIILVFLLITGFILELISFSNFLSIDFLFSSLFTIIFSSIVSVFLIRSAYWIKSLNQKARLLNISLFTFIIFNQIFFIGINFYSIIEFQFQRALVVVMSFIGLYTLGFHKNTVHLFNN